MIRSGTGLALGAAAILAGCSILDPARGEPIPPNAQVVHVTIRDETVQLQPDRVRAGDIYLVIDEPPDGSIVFVGGGESSGELGPLASGAIERLERGDTEGTGISGFQAGGCSDEQAEAARGRTGPCGNVMQVRVSPGHYAVMTDAPEAGGVPVTVLTVTP